MSKAEENEWKREIHHLYLWELPRFVLFYQRVFQLSRFFLFFYLTCCLFCWLVQYSVGFFFSCSSFICSWFGLVQCWLFSTIADNFTCHICFMQTVHRHTPIARIHNRNLKILSVVCIVRECFCFVVRFYLLILNVFTRNCDMPTRESLQLDHRYCWKFQHECFGCKSTQ